MIPGQNAYLKRCDQERAAGGCSSPQVCDLERKDVNFDLIKAFALMCRGSVSQIKQESREQTVKPSVILRRAVVSVTSFC